MPCFILVSDRWRNESVSLIGNEVLHQQLKPSGSWKLNTSSEAIFRDSWHYVSTLRVGRQPFWALTPGVQQTACVVGVMYCLFRPDTALFFCVFRLYYAPDSHFSLFSAFFRRGVHKYKITVRLSWNVDISQFGVGIIGPNSRKSSGHVERMGNFIIAKSEEEKSLRSPRFRLEDNIKMNLKETRVNDSRVLGCYGELRFHFIPDVSKGRTAWKNFWTLPRKVGNQ